MADEVVGKVQVDVHGNTEPLKRDIRQAATEAGKALDAGIGEGAGGTAITDNIVQQVTDAQQPAEVEGRKVGRAVVRGVRSGTRQAARDSDPIVDAYRRDLNRVGTSIGESFYTAAADPLERIRQKVRSVLSDDTGSINIGGRSVIGSDDLANNVQREVRRSGAKFQKSGQDAGDAITKGMRKAVSGGIFDVMFKLFAGKIALMGTGIAFAVRAAAPALVGLSGQIAAIGTGLAGLGVVGAAGLATMIPAVGALKLAFTGMDAEAKKALSERFAVASGDLAGFKERVRNELIPGLLEATKTVSKLAPEINKLGTDSAKAGGRVAKAFANMFVGRKEEISNIFGNAPVIMEKFGKSGAGAVGAIIGAISALQPLIMDMVSALTSGLDNMTRALNRSVESGTFVKTMEEWVDRGKLVLQILKNLGTVVVNFLNIGADSSDDFLTTFEELTQKWADWTKSIQGQNSIKNMFDEAKPVVEEVWGLLGDIGGLFKESFTGDTSGLVDFIKTIREDVIPGIEAFQDMLRESGLQKSLYDFGKAIMELFDAGGGSTAKAFLDTLTIFVNLLADLTRFLGPALGPLLKFYGIMKALSLLRMGASGLLGLPAMLSNMVSPANKAATAMGNLNAAAGLGAPAAVGRTARLSGAMSNLSSKLGVAAIAYAALSTVASTTAPKFDDSAERLDKWTKDASKGLVSLRTDAEAGIKKSVWESWASPLGSVLDKGSDFLKGNFTGTRTVGEELGADLGGGIVSGFKRFTAGLGVDWAGVGASTDAVKTQFKAISDSLAATGDSAAAERAFTDLKDLMHEAGIDAGLFADEMYELSTNIDKAKQSAVVAGTEQGIDVTGVFQSVEQAKRTLGLGLSTDVQSGMTAILNNPAFRDAKDKLNREGQAALRTLYEDAGVSIKGYGGVLADAATKDFIDIFTDPSSFDEYDRFTQKAQERFAARLVALKKANRAAIAAEREDLRTLMQTVPESGPRGEMGGPGADTGKFFRSFGKALIDVEMNEVKWNELDQDLRTRFGKEAYEVRARLLKEQPELAQDAEKLNALIAYELEPFVLKFETERSIAEAEAEIAALVGKDWEFQIPATVPPSSFVDIGGQLLKFTKEGGWQVIVGAEADTARAQGDIIDLTNGPGGNGWQARVETLTDAEEANLTLKNLGTKDKPFNVYVRSKDTDVDEATFALKNLGTPEDPHYVYVETTDTDTTEAQVELKNLGTKKNPHWVWVEVTDDGSARKTGNEIDREIGPSKRKVTVTVNYVGGSRSRRNAQGELVPDEAIRTTSMLPVPPLIPPSEPSTISPGGPSTFGYGESFTPFAGTRASFSLDSLFLGRPTVDVGEEARLERERVIVNNYYPEPEKVSDSVAMTMRLIRFYS